MTYLGGGTTSKLCEGDSQAKASFTGNECHGHCLSHSAAFFSMAQECFSSLIQGESSVVNAWLPLSNRCFLKKKEKTSFRYSAFESVKHLLGGGLTKNITFYSK